MSGCGAMDSNYLDSERQILRIKQLEKDLVDRGKRYQILSGQYCDLLKLHSQEQSEKDKLQSHLFSMKSLMNDIKSQNKGLQKQLEEHKRESAQRIDEIQRKCNELRAKCRLQRYQKEEHCVVLNLLSDEEEDDKIKVEGKRMNEDDVKVNAADTKCFASIQHCRSTDNIPTLGKFSYSDCSYTNNRDSIEVAHHIYGENDQFHEKAMHHTATAATSENQELSENREEEAKLENFDVENDNTSSRPKDHCEQNGNYNEQPYQCKMCGKRFNNRGSHWMHIRTTHSDERPFQCSHCDSSFKTQGNCNRHIRSVHFRCGYCSKGFHSKSHLISHMRVHTGERPFQCKVCKKTFKAKSNLTMHERVHSEKKPYECSKCHKAYKQSGHMRRHEKNCKY